MFSTPPRKREHVPARHDCYPNKKEKKLQRSFFIFFKEECSFFSKEKKSIFDHPTLASVWFWPSNSKTEYL